MAPRIIASAPIPCSRFSLTRVFVLEKDSSHSWYRVPIRIRGRLEYVRAVDIPEPARSRFFRAIQGYPVPLVAGEGRCAYAIEWENWLYGGGIVHHSVQRNRVYRRWEARAIERGLDRLHDCIPHSHTVVRQAVGNILSAPLVGEAGQLGALQ